MASDPLCDALHCNNVIYYGIMANPDSADQHDRLLTAQELANYLEVPLATIYAWRHRREGPPGFRVGKHLRFRWAEVEGWISDRIHNFGPVR